MTNYDTATKTELIEQIEGLQEDLFALGEDLAEARERVAELEAEARLFENDGSDVYYGGDLDLS